jgi:FAD/FMN-containing dehydrogenase
MMNGGQQMVTMLRTQAARQLSSVEVDLFAAELRGQLLRPGEAAYDHARIQLRAGNAEYPALIVRCADLDDARIAQDFAWHHRLTLAVRGGHDIADLASGHGALVIDRSAMVDLTLDAAAQTARAGVGLHPADLAAALRAHHLASDYLLAVEILLPDGRRLRASASTHPDHFHAALSGGDIGIVTAFEYRLRPLS